MRHIAKPTVQALGGGATPRRSTQVYLCQVERCVAPTEALRIHGWSDVALGTLRDNEVLSACLEKGGRVGDLFVVVTSLRAPNPHFNSCKCVA